MGRSANIHGPEGAEGPAPPEFFHLSVPVQDRGRFTVDAQHRDAGGAEGELTTEAGVGAEPARGEDAQ